MSSLTLRWLVGLVVFSFVSQGLNAQEWKSGTYRIVSGTYVITGGQAPLLFSLPNLQQEFIVLTVGTTEVQMRLLASDGRTTFAPRPDFDFNLTNGYRAADHLEFFTPAYPPLPGRYTMSNSNEGLRIDGTVSFPPVCCDNPFWYEHVNVVAVPVPSLAVRMSQMEVSWIAASNRAYQVQFRSALDTNRWTNLGLPIPGTGMSTSVQDAVPAGAPQRFYRVIPVAP